MKKFSVGKEVFDFNGYRDLNIGMAPGSFDTKQLVLSSIVMLSRQEGEHIRFIRSVDSNQLSKCNFFINDAFVSLIPSIPSYNDIENVWKKSGEKILTRFGIREGDYLTFCESVILEKISNLECVDCLMELYNPNEEDEGFETALNMAMQIINNILADTIRESMYIPTVRKYLGEMEGNYLALPIHVKNWRGMVELFPEGTQVDYVILPEGGEIYSVECIDKTLPIRRYTKGMRNLAYAGRFCAKAGSFSTAVEIIKRLPRIQEKQKAKFA